jgi:hypothetical protein
MIRALMSALIAGLMSLPASANEMLPTYRIVSEDGEKNALRIAVRLEERQIETTLQAIADDVRSACPKVTVHFFLPSSEISDKAWAEVRLTTPQPSRSPAYGATKRKLFFRAEAASDRRNRVGVWLISPPALTGRLTIYRDTKGASFAEWRLRNRQTTTDALQEVRTPRGRRFVIADSDGGYYQIGANGTLELGVQGRRIAIAEPLKVGAPAIAERTPGKPMLVSDAARNPVSPAAQTGASEVADGAAPATAKAAARRSTATVRKKPIVRQAEASFYDNLGTCAITAGGHPGL